MLYGQSFSRLTGRLFWGQRRILFGQRGPLTGGGRRLRAGLLAAAVAWLTLLAGSATASASQLLYYGGPVVHSANVVLVEWGPDVRSTYTNPTTGDPGLFKYLSSQNGSTTDIGGVLAQYMDSTGHNSQNNFTFLGAVQINPSVAPTPPGKVLDSQIQSVLANQINGGVLPAPAGNGLTTIYVVLFPPNDNVCFDASSCAYGNNGGFCAYHGSFNLNSSTNILYAAMVDNGPGTPNFGGCGGNASDVGNQTSVVSHETSETINDPLNQVASWYDYNANGEIADKCDAQPLAANGPFTVEPIWSDINKGCESGEPAYSAPTASFLAPSTGSAGQQLSFNAGSSSDPAADSASATNQNNGATFSISSGIASYQWNWGDGSANTTSSNPNASHTFAGAGNYQVSLTVTDHLGFKSTKTLQVSVGGGSPGTPQASTGTATGLDSQDATLNGTVNPEGQSVSYQFELGTDPTSLQAYGSPTALSGQTTTPVSASVSGLTPGTTYYYQLVVTYGANPPIDGGVQSFTTPTGGPPPPTPMVVTGPAGFVSTSGAVLTGTINPEGQPVVYQFNYGTSASNLSQSTTGGTLPSGTSNDTVSATLSGLASSTTYYYQLVATAGGTAYPGSVQSFTTTAVHSNVITGGASNINGDSAVVSGLVNPRGRATIYQVQYGPTAAYGFSTTWITIGSGTTYKHVSEVLFGLRSRTTYHYRFVAQNSRGTSVGGDRTFTTAAAGNAPRMTIEASSGLTWHRLETAGLPVRFTCSEACTAHLLIVAEPQQMERMGAMSTTVARAQAECRQAGSGSAVLRLSPAFRNRVSQATRLLVLGYATAARSPASPPQAAAVTLTR